MTERNFPAALAFVWGPGRDAPADGPHTTPLDPGGLTNGGVTQDTWDSATQTGVVSGKLQNATIAQLTAVLKAKFWNPYCPALPDGVDLLVFNGTVMSGRYAKLFQQCLGLTDGSVDGWIGKFTAAAASNSDPATLIQAVHGTHSAYLRTLATWPQFGDGWEARLDAARDAALALVEKGNSPS
jgi:lysozyme family protein